MRQQQFKGEALMADTCAKDNNDVWFGTQARHDEPVLYGPKVQVTWDLPASNDTCASGSRPGGADRSAWARRAWRAAPTAAAPRDSAHARSVSQAPIAIIGMGGCLPDAPSVDVFWDNICRNHVAIGTVPKDRWNAPLYYSADRKAVDRTYSQIGGYIRAFDFDSRKFRIPPRSLACIDDLQKMALSCVAEALGRANLEIFAGDKSGRPFDRERTAVIMGNSMGGEAEDLTSLRVWLTGVIDAMQKSAEAQGLDAAAIDALVQSVHAKYDALLPPVTEDSMPGELSNCITGRVANAFDLWGPNFTTDAACASSIAALQMAVNGLQNHEFDLAVAGGADRSMDPPTYVKFSKIGALSADKSAPFDASANGFVMGEGVGVLLLKRLEDAERDGDTIYALVRGIGAASDGRGRGITAPNPRGQRLAIERAYAAAEVPLTSVGLFEAHGTSTPVGDNVELGVLTTLMREGQGTPRQVPIGSVKSMIGHLKSASGAASLIKTALALHHKVLPPSANFNTPPAQSPLHEGYLMVNTQTRSWQHNPDASGSPRRAGVSSFGFGGTNFHAVLEEYVPGAHKPASHVPHSGSKGRIDAAATHAGAVAHGADGSVCGPQIIDLFANATGYDPADLVPSHQLEADLGIDTVKQAEVLGLIRSQFKLPEDASFQLSSMPTLQHIIDYVSGFGDASKSSASAPDSHHGGNGSGPSGPPSGPAAAQVLVFGASNVACTLAQATSELAAASQLGGALLQGRTAAGQAPTRLAFVAEDVQKARSKVLSAGQKGARMLAAQGIFIAEGAPLAKQGKLAFVFPGQGSQYLGMLKDLAECYPIVAATFAEADRVLTPLVGHALTPIVWAAQTDEADKLLRETQNCQPAMLTADVALLRLLMAHGVKPDMVAGHSLGEYAAAVASGVLSFADALYAVSARGREMASVKVEDVGKMAMVAADAGRVEPILAEMQGYVIAANKNCHTQTVIAGDSATVDAAIARFAQVGIEARQIAVSHAFHSSIVAPAAAPLAQVLGNLDVQAPQIPLSSNVTAGYYPAERQAIVGLMADQLASPVQFIDQVERLYADGARLFVEVGPRRAITGFVRNILGQREHRALAANHPKKPGVHGFLELLAALAAEGVAIDFAAGAPTQLRAAKPHSALSAVAAAPAPSAAPQPQAERVVVSGMAVAVPQARPTGSMQDDLFAPLLAGDNYIQPLVDDERKRILDKHVTRLNKRTGTFVPLQEMSEVIQLVARLGEVDLAEYNIDAALAEALDDTGRLAIATGIDALRDAGLPLMQRMRTTSTGKALHDRWALPPKLAARTGVVLASAFTGLSSIIEEVSRQAALAGRRQGAEIVQQFINTWADTLSDPSEAKRLREAFAEQIQGEIDGDLLYRFNRKWLFRALSLGHAQLAQAIFAQGPNTQINAACASGPQAMGIAEDWIRQGRCERVVVVTADNATHPASLPWLGAAFLAAGAASVEAKLENAAVPFGAQRNGMILGAGAAAFIVERESCVKARGMQPIAEVVHTHFGNSAFHGTRMDIGYIEGFVKDAIDAACAKQNITPAAFAKTSFFMSHETYTPARGGSAAAEVAALRHAFGSDVRNMLVANTKGRTGHPMGGSIEDAVAIKGLQRQQLPPIANFSQVDPSFEDLLLAQGGAHDRAFAVRFGAGFGSQVAVSIYRRMATQEARLQSAQDYAQWLVAMGAPANAGLEIVGRTLRVATQGGCRVEQLGITALSVIGQAATRPAPAEQQADVPRAAPPPHSLPKAAAAAGPSAARAQWGIDTVKQAEIFATIRRDYNIPTDEAFKLSDVQTLAALSQYVVQQAAPSPEAQASAGEAPSVQQPAAAEAAPVIAAPALPREAVLQELIKVFAEATGYDAADLDPSHALEADLGIDTVKQAEIFGMVRSTYQLAPDEAFKLSEVQTLDSMADYVLARLTQTAVADAALAAPPAATTAPAAASTAPSPEPVQPATPVASASKPMTAPHDAAAILQRITQIFAEQTGYALEDLHPTHNLEADLGIDTVKQAEIFALIRQAHGLATDENFRLSDVQSLKAIADYVFAQQPQGPEPEPPAKASVPMMHQAPPPAMLAAPMQAPKSAAPLADAAQPGHSRAAVLHTLTRLFAEATGYDVGDFAPEHQLEADMGIDTVKQAEILAQVRHEYGIGAETQFNLSQVQTLNALADYVIAQASLPAADTAAVEPEPTKASEPVAVSTPTPTPTPTPAASLAAPDAPPEAAPQAAAATQPTAFEARMVRLQQVTAPVASADRSGLARRRVVLAGGEPHSRRAMREALLALHAHVHVLEAPSHAPGAARAQAYEARLRQMGDTLPDMLIYLAPDIQKVQWVSAPAAELFALARYWAKAAKGAPEGGLLVVGQGGGGFGFAAEQAFDAAAPQTPRATYNLQGAVLAALSGAVKSLAKEWPKARCLALDIATPEPWPTAVERALGAWSGWSRMPDASAELVYRDKQWWVPRRMATALTPSGTALGARSLVVATGGARGVTFSLLQQLAARRPFQLIVLGRTKGCVPAQSPLHGKDEAEQKTLAKAALASEHRRATPAAVRLWIARAQAQIDIHHNLESLREAGSCPGRLAVALHGAGVEESKFIIDKDAEAFARIYNPKAEALLRLWTALQPHRTVTMGSVSGRFGNAGQVDYAAANEMMAGLARAPQHRMLNLGWTAWADIGMAQRGSVKQVLEAHGVVLLPAAEGLRIGVGLIDSDVVGDVVVAGALGAFERGEAAAHNVQHSAPAEPGLWPQLFDRQSTLADGAVLLERSFDPHHDVGLDHHRIDGVPVLPGVLGVEMMVQAASHVLDSPITHLQDVRFASPAKLFRDAPLSIGVEVRVDGDSARLAVVSAFVGPRGQTMRREHFTAVAAKVQAASLLQGSRADDLELARDPALSPSDVYQRYFHGPAFQVLGQICVLGENGGDALMQTERPIWLRGTTHSDFVTMPYAREAAFQIAGLWEMVEMGRMALPSGVDVIQLAPKAQAKAPHQVMARRRLSQNDVAVFDIWTLDADGEVIDLMLGYRTVVLRELTQAERFEPATHALWPKQSRPTSLVLPLDRVEPLLLDSASVGLEHFLSASELARLASFTLPKRRLEWLGARIAAKRLIRETLFGRSGATVPYNAIIIERDELGAPVVRIVGDDQPAPRISLSHSAQLAVAFLSPSPDVRCGVDCEGVETRDPSFMQTYFSPREQEQAKRAEDTAYALTEMWAVKEAVLKALGLGARVDFRDVEALSTSRGWQVVLHKGAERRAHELQVGACQVEVERHQTRVIARVLLPNDGTVLPANVFTSNLEVRA
ncbi:hypothetical protein Q3G72_010920 [Acer saccharum]|nr:hypothetical protein Q3G72_010920 [Acer saccharum]